MRIASIVLFLIINLYTPAHGAYESDYQKEWCNSEIGTIEYRLDNGTRVDCLTSGYAIEFDFARKWAESIAQAIYYSARTDRMPGVVLIMLNQKDCKYLHRFNTVTHTANIGITVWQTGDYAYKCNLIHDF